MLISSSKFVNHTFMHPSKGGYPFFWLFSWGRALILLPVTIWHDSILLNTSICNSYSFFRSSRIPLKTFLIERNSIILTIFTYSDIIPSFHESHTRCCSQWNTCVFQYVNLSMKTPMEDSNHAYLENDPFEWCMISFILYEFLLFISTNYSSNEVIES